MENQEKNHQEEEEPEITLELVLNYLDELRKHLIIPLVIFLVVFAISIPFSKKMLEVFLLPFKDIVPNFIFIKPFESFWVHIKTSAYFSGLISSPVLIWRIWLFISPALYEKERKLVSAIVLAVIFLFISGTLFGYFIVLPASLKFLIKTFSSEDIRAMITISEFFSFCLKFSVAFGLSFQTPIIMVVVVKTGLVERDTLVKMRPYAIVFAFVIAAIVTPTPDALTQTALAVPLIILWEIGLIVSKILK